MAEEKTRGFGGEQHDPYRPGGATADFSPKQGGERGFEIGKDESWTARMASGYDLWLANHKRTYDEFMHESLEELRRRRAQFDESFTRSRDHSQELHNVALQALQNAVTQANMVAMEALKHTTDTNFSADLTGKQAVAHRDIATNSEWSVFKEGVEAAVVKAVNATVPSAVEAAVASRGIKP